MIILISRRFLNQLMYEPEWEDKVWEFYEADLEWWELKLWQKRN